MQKWDREREREGCLGNDKLKEKNVWLFGGWRFEFNEVRGFKFVMGDNIVNKQSLIFIFIFQSHDLENYLKELSF